MKTKQLCLAIAAVSALAWASCTGAGEEASSADNLFGGIPALYEKKMKALEKEIEAVKKEKSPDAIIEMLAKVETAYEEVGKEAQPMADQLVGKTVPYSLAEELPYRIVSDIVVEGVILPKMDITGEKPMKLRVAFDVVPLQKGASVAYCLLTDDRTNIGEYSISIQKSPSINELLEHKSSIGDTLHFSTTLKAPDVPASQLKHARSLKFVTEEVFRTEREAVWKLQKELNKSRKE